MELLCSDGTVLLATVRSQAWVSQETGCPSPVARGERVLEQEMSAGRRAPEPPPLPSLAGHGRGRNSSQSRPDSRALQTCNRAGSCHALAGWKSHRETVWPVHGTKVPGPGVAPSRLAKNRATSTLVGCPCREQGNLHLPTEVPPTHQAPCPPSGIFSHHISQGGGWR